MTVFPPDKRLQDPAYGAVSDTTGKDKNNVYDIVNKIIELYQTKVNSNSSNVQVAKETLIESGEIIKQYGEVFVPVRGYEGYYEVSNYGEVKSIPRKNTKGGILKSVASGPGYLQVSLSSDNSIISHSVHRLVALNFISNPKKYTTVNHIDGNKQNNHVDNLEWCTQAENNSHARRTGLSNTFKENHYRAKLTQEQVDDIRLLFSEGKKYKEIGKKFEVSPTTIRAIINGRSWKKEVL